MPRMMTTTSGTWEEDTLAYDDEEDCLTDEGGWEPAVDDAEAGHCGAR